MGGLGWKFSMVSQGYDPQVDLDEATEWEF